MDMAASISAPFLAGSEVELRINGANLVTGPNYDKGLKSNPTKFQYAISVRLKLKPNEPDKSQTVVFRFVIVVQFVQSVPSARSPHGVFHGRPPFNRELRRLPARLTYRGPPQPAPELCGSRRCSKGPGLSIVGGANRGETSGKAARGRARADSPRAGLLQPGPGWFVLGPASGQAQSSVETGKCRVYWCTENAPPALACHCPCLNCDVLKSSGAPSPLPP